MSIYEKLFDWQKKVVDEYKTQRSFGLFLDMGLGKTPLSLAMAEANHCTKVIVISINSKVLESASIPGSWFDWARKSEIKYTEICKFNDKSQQDRAEMLLINYEALYKRNQKNSVRTNSIALKDELLQFLQNCKGHNVAIIVDESHKMKNLQSHQTKAIEQIKRQCHRYAGTNNTFCYLLTGTPFTTGYIDLYSQLKFLGCEMNKGEFIDRFCERGHIPGLLGWQQPIVSYKNLNELYNLLHRYALTTKSEFVIKLPEQMFNYYPLQKSIDFDMFTHEKMKANDIALYAKKRKIKFIADKNIYVNNPFYRNIDYPSDTFLAQTSGAYWLRSRELSIGFVGNAQDATWYDTTRLEFLKMFLTNNEANYVLFYNYTPELLELYDICTRLGYNVDVFCGEAKSLHFYEKYCSQTVEQRLTNNKNIIISNFASGSTGMNWQLYHECIIFSLPIYKDYAQALKRVHRTGQTHTTAYHIMYQENYLDNGMLKALQEQCNYSEQMFESDHKRVQDILGEV